MSSLSKSNLIGLAQEFVSAQSALDKLATQAKVYLAEKKNLQAKAEQTFKCLQVAIGKDSSVVESKVANSEALDQYLQVLQQLVQEEAGDKQKLADAIFKQVIQPVLSLGDLLIVSSEVLESARKFCKQHKYLDSLESENLERYNSDYAKAIPIAVRGTEEAYKNFIDKLADQEKNIDKLTSEVQGLYLRVKEHLDELVGNQLSGLNLDLCMLSDKVISIKGVEAVGRGGEAQRVGKESVMKSMNKHLQVTVFRKMGEFLNNRDKIRKKAVSKKDVEYLVPSMDEVRSNDELIVMLSHYPSLRELDLSAVRRFVDNEVLTEVVKLRHMQILSLEWCAKIIDFGPLSGMTQLTSLNLKGCLQIKDLRCLRGLIQMSSLNLEGCRNIIDLDFLDGMSQMTSLNLEGCKEITDLGNLACMTHLQDLNLGWCMSLTDECIKDLAGMTGLQSLNLAACSKISDLSPLAGMNQLINLNLSFCKMITNAEIKHLENMRCLQKLSLYRCKITNAGLVALTAEKLPHLTSLDLSDCGGITDEVIAEVAQLRHLTSLDLSDCGGITEKGIARLRDAFPKIEIKYS